MNSIIKNSLLLISAFLYFAPPLTAAETNKFFPVMPWNGIPNDRVVMEKIKDCGFTVAGFVTPKGLEICRKVGLKGIVADARISGYDWTNVDEKAARTKALSAIKAVLKNPALYGYELRDEPGASAFPGLAVLSSLIQENAPGKWPYINLFPNYANAEQMGCATYDEYLEKFIAVCHPTQLSYDHYALMDNGSLGGAYWQNLEQMRAVALKHNLPFWNIVLGVAHFSFREPTAADLRFEVYSSLAYGARGIAYFTYFAPHSGNYRAAAVDQFGHETPTWNYLQNVNLQIQKLAPTLLELTSDDTYHFGTIPNGCHGPTTNSLVAAITGEFAVGDFTHTDGSRYVLLVNENLTKSVPCQPHYRNHPKSVKLISPYSGKPVAYEGEQIWLAPGAGRLLKLSYE